jgi:acetyl esterase/lipase
MDSPKYAKFDVSDVTYKVVNEQEIKAYVLTPKGISPGKYPIVVKFHGGYFVSPPGSSRLNLSLTLSKVTGSSLFPEWYQQWVLDYCLLHSAIIVTGDYRMLPESTGADLYEDISDFWDWLRADLQAVLDRARPGVEADFDKLLVHGESAGGAITMVSAFSQPAGSIKAVIPMYPAIDIAGQRTEPTIEVPLIPESVLRDHLSAILPGKIVTAATPPERMDIAISMAQQGAIGAYYGTDPKHDLWKLLEGGADMPYTLILHGAADSAVPVEGSIKWVEAARKKFGDGKVKLHVEPGGEHGFDCAVPLSTPWLEEELKVITALWLGP